MKNKGLNVDIRSDEPKFECSKFDQERLRKSAKSTISVLRQGCQIWAQSGSVWPQMGQIRDQTSVHLCFVPDSSHLGQIWPTLSPNRIPIMVAHGFYNAVKQLRSCYSCGDKIVRHAV